MLPELGDSPMAKTPNLVQDIINKKAAEVSPATIRQIVTVIRQIFSIALDRKLIQRLPRIVIPEMNERIREIPTPEQVQFILWASETSKHGFGLWLKLGTGMSWSEMLALNWQDFDNLNRTVSVNKAFVRANGSYEVKDIKTREDLRQIALPRKVNDILAKKKKVGKMFQTESGQYLTPGSWQRLWNEWLKQANVMIEAHNTKLEEGEKPVPSIRNVRFHELRLFYASTLLAEKVTPDVAQILIGYKEIIALHLIDTYTGVIIIGLCNASTIFFFRQYLSGLPRELLDAARIDGATEYGIATKIILPLTKPAFASMGSGKPPGSRQEMPPPAAVP